MEPICLRFVAIISNNTVALNIIHGNDEVNAYDKMQIFCARLINHVLRWVKIVLIIVIAL